MLSQSVQGIASLDSGCHNAAIVSVSLRMVEIGANNSIISYRVLNNDVGILQGKTCISPFHFRSSSKASKA